MTDKETVERFREKLGIDRTVREYARRGNKLAYKIQLNKYQTLDLIQLIQEYLVTKRHIAKQIMEESKDGTYPTEGFEENVLGSEN